MSKQAPLAFSYIRFSTKEQARGESLRRQSELRDAWCERNGVRLDTSVTLQDKGVSGFTGVHRENPDRHALAAFLRLVEQGRIPRGSYLVVENLDRLSREHIQPALLLFLGLLQAGVRVVQLLPAEMVYDAKSEGMAVMMAVMELSRGNSESAMKSARVGDAWRKKREKAAAGGHVLTRSCPAWLKVEDNALVPIPAAAAAVRKVYQLATAGYGATVIARKLNTDGVPPIGTADHWCASYVGLLLSDRRPMGFHQPRKWVKNVPGERIGDGIPGYLPAVVSEKEWHAARAVVAGRRWARGRTGEGVTNLFRGLLFDAKDGGPIHVQKHDDKQYLKSYRGRLGLSSNAVPFPLSAFESAVLSRLREIDPRDLLNEDQSGADETLALTGRLNEIDTRLAEMTDRLVSGSGSVGVIEAAARKLEAERITVGNALSDARLKAASPTSEAWGECKSLLDLLAKSKDVTATRMRLRGLLRRMVSQVWCVFVGVGKTRLAAVQMHFHEGGHRSFLIRYQVRRVTGHGNKFESSWEVESFAGPVGIADLDLRKPGHAKKLAAWLEANAGTVTSS